MSVILRAVSARAARFSVSRSILFVAAFTLVGSGGCGRDEPLVPPGGTGPAGPGGGGEPGPTVNIEGRTVESGFARGHMRQSTDLDSFAISRHPVTIGEYRACERAGRCDAPRESACSDSAERAIIQRPTFRQEGVADDVPATCMGLKGARQYCTWVGGGLPTLEQWFLAARGPKPQQYPWGNSRATCEQHPLGLRVEAECPRNKVRIGPVEQHPAGVSPGGVKDVLLTPAELLEISDNALFTACQTDKKGKAGDDRACLVYGFAPGAIDSVAELSATAEQPDTSSTAYGFRCSWGDAS
jgi:hypothetical protein